MIEIEALRLALSKEEDAIKTYQDMLVRYPALTELLSFLVTQEQKHKAMIEKKISDLSGY